MLSGYTGVQRRRTNTKEAAKNSIILYKKWKKPLQRLSLEQKGRILDALLDFPDIPEFDDPMLVMAWDFMADALEENDKKWDEIREKRSAAGQKSAESKRNKTQQKATNSANVDFVEQTQQKATNSTVSVSEYVPVSEYVSVISPNGDVYKGESAAVDVELSRIIQHYEGAVGSFPRSAFEKLQKWRKAYSTDMILLAIDKAAEAGKRSWSYIHGILSGWQRDGLRTPGDVAAAEERRTTQKANAPRNKAFMASRPPEEAEKAGDFLKNAAHRRSLKKKGDAQSA